MHLVLAFLAAVPVFTAARVLPANSNRPAPLSPGMIVSIYGENLGPDEGCTGHADTKNRETPNPARPRQMFVNTLIYPKELCGVRVFVGDKPAGLLWAQAKQINFKVPQDAPLEGTAPLRVVFNVVSSAPVPMKLSVQSALLVFEGPLTTLGPVWVTVVGPPGEVPDIRYPFTPMFWPAGFGCHLFEVRRNGALLLPRKAEPVGIGGVASGFPCGSIGLPGAGPEPRRDRIPLHLAYRFDKPGVYEVRYSYSPMFGPPEQKPTVLPLTPWTRLEIRPWTEAQRAEWLRSLKPPTEAGLMMTDYLPSILGIPDTPSLDLLVPVLYHPEDLVRRFAQSGLGIWPKEQWEPTLKRALQSRGPSDVITDVSHGSLTVAALAPYLQSNDPVLLRGALRGFQNLIYWSPQTPLPPAERTTAESALIAARDRIFAVADPQTQIDYTSLLGGLHDTSAGKLLWDLVSQRRAAREQALIAIMWRKDPADLPRLAAEMEGPGDGDPLSHRAASLPYALRNSYGDAAIPYLLRSLAQSPQVFVRTNCARELILVNHPAGFAFVASAIETKERYSLEMVQFVKDRFPELRNADNAAVLAFLKQRAK